jgi:hypothetical protein
MDAAHSIANNHTEIRTLVYIIIYPIPYVLPIHKSCFRTYDVGLRNSSVLRVRSIFYSHNKSLRPYALSRPNLIKTPLNGIRYNV